MTPLSENACNAKTALSRNRNVWRWLACGALMLGSALPAHAEDLARSLGGWYNDGWNADSHAVYMANAHMFSEVSPLWYDLGPTDENESDDANVPPLAHYTDGTMSQRAVFNAQQVADVHFNRDLIIPTISDHPRRVPGRLPQLDMIMNDDTLTRLLDPISLSASCVPQSETVDKTPRQRLQEQIVNYVICKGYDGIDLDFEYGTGASHVKFVSFVGDLAVALHAAQRVLVVTVPPTLKADEEDRRPYKYAELTNNSVSARKVDWIKVMAYDHQFEFEPSETPPVSAAKISWVTDVLNYMKSVSVPAAKLELGLPNYAVYWDRQSPSSPWKVFGDSTNYQLAQANAGAAVWQFDAITAMTPNATADSYAEYPATALVGEPPALGPVTRRVYAGTASSIDARSGLVDAIAGYSLKGLTFYALGREDPAIYSLLCTQAGVGCVAPLRTQPASMGFPANHNGVGCFDQGAAGVSNLCSTTRSWAMPVIWDTVPPGSSHTLSVRMQQSGASLSCTYYQYRSNGLLRSSVTFSAPVGSGTYKTMSATASSVNPDVDRDNPAVNPGDFAFVECAVPTGNVHILGLAYN